LQHCRFALPSKAAERLSNAETIDAYSFVSFQRYGFLTSSQFKRFPLGTLVAANPHGKASIPDTTRTMVFEGGILCAKL